MTGSTTSEAHPPTSRPVAGSVVVGVDGSDVSRLALRRAALEAAVHGVPLEVVHAWNFLDQHGAQFDPHFGEHEARVKIEQFVDETLGTDRPADTVVRIVNDHAGPALLEASDGAFVLVVGDRGLSGLKSVLLGSVSHHVVHRASCPVLVVR